MKSLLVVFMFREKGLVLVGSEVSLYKSKTYVLDCFFWTVLVSIMISYVYTYIKMCFLGLGNGR